MLTVHSVHHAISQQFFSEVWEAIGGDPGWVDAVRFSGDGSLRSPFAITDLAAAVFAANGAAVAELVATVDDTAPPAVRVDRRLASGWFDIPIAPSRPLVPVGARAAAGNPWMTEFRTADNRWLRLQASFPTLRARIVNALGVPEDLAAVEQAVGRHQADEIEQLVVGAGGTVAASRTVDEWTAHPQGQAVSAEPLVRVELGSDATDTWHPTPGRALAGIRVLDLTRVVAGPMATRFLAACGAEVLRLDVPGSDESSGPMGQGSDIVLGKRWAFLDLRTGVGRQRFLELLSEADVFVYAYRPGFLDNLDLGTDIRAATRPGLVEVALDAYGWTGPWSTRRGFDTLVQFSTGLANETTAWALERPETRTPINALGRLVSADRPRHMPVETLDFATGYMAAAAAIRGLTRRVTSGRGSSSFLSLARTAALLISAGRFDESEECIELPIDGPVEDRIYATTSGPTRRLQFPVQIERNPLFWERSWEAAGSSTPAWSSKGGR